MRSTWRRMIELVKTIVDPIFADEKREVGLRRQEALDDYYLTTVSRKLQGLTNEDHIESGKFWINGIYRRGDISKTCRDILLGVIKYQKDLLPKEAPEDDNRRRVPWHVLERAKRLELEQRKKRMRLIVTKDDNENNVVEK